MCKSCRPKGKKCRRPAAVPVYGGAGAEVSQEVFSGAQHWEMTGAAHPGHAEVCCAGIRMILMPGGCRVGKGYIFALYLTQMEISP